MTSWLTALLPLTQLDQLAGLAKQAQTIDAQHVEWIGTAAAALTTLSFVPQVWLTLRTRDVSGISLGMYLCFTLGVALWLVYGLFIGSRPVTVANCITLTLALIILGMKLRYGRGSGAGKPRD